MYRQQTKKLRSQLLLLNTYIIFQHVLQMMVQSTLTVFVLFFFFLIWQLSTYVFIVFFFKLFL